MKRITIHDFWLRKLKNVSDKIFVKGDFTARGSDKVMSTYQNSRGIIHAVQWAYSGNTIEKPSTTTVLYLINVFLPWTLKSTCNPEILVGSDHQVHLRGD